MKTETQINPKTLKGILFLVLFITLILKSSVSLSQPRDRKGDIYKGFSVSFGTRSFTTTSDIKELNGLSVLQDGGQVGLLYGGRVLRGKLNSGFYYAASRMAYTVDLFEGESVVNFYPLSIFSKEKKRLEVYLTGGLVYNKVKFYGHYLDEDNIKVNYSASTEPYLGNIHQTRAAIGAGFEVKMIDHNDFVHLFAEVKYGFALSENTNYAAFKGTSSSNMIQGSVGVSFGMYH